MKDRILLTEEAGYVSVGSHIGVLSDDYDDIHALLRESFEIGLSSSDCCVFASSPESVRKFAEMLESGGVDVNGEIEKGALVFISEREALLKYEVEFEPDHVLSIVGTLFQDKVRDGYETVRLYLDVSWLLRGTPGRERMMEFEAKADETINVSGVPMIALCQYLRDELDQDQESELLRRHPLTITDGKLKENPDYRASAPEG